MAFARLTDHRYSTVSIVFNKLKHRCFCVSDTSNARIQKSMNIHQGERERERQTESRRLNNKWKISPYNIIVSRRKREKILQIEKNREHGVI